jgi:hypothetical protein
MRRYGCGRPARATASDRPGIWLGVCLVLAHIGSAIPCEAQVFQLRGLRAVFGAGYEQATNTVVNGEPIAYDDSLFSPLVTVQGSVALLDPQILNLNATVDFRLTQRKHRSDTTSYDASDRLGSARLDMTILSGRGAPLRLYYARSDSRFQQRPLTADLMPLDLARTGDERTRGFSWDVTPRRFPRVSLTGFATRRRDHGSMLAGQDNSSRMDRFEARANQTHRLARYDVSFTRDSTGFDYPLNGVASSQGIDMLRATTTVTPAKTFAVDLSTRGSRYHFSANDRVGRNQGFSGWGGDATFRWAPSQHWQATGSYSMSTNLVEMALSSSAGAAAANRVSLQEQPATTTMSLTRRSLYQEGTGWLRYFSSSRSTTLAVGGHVLSLDPLSLGMATLAELRTANATVDHSRRAAGLDISAGAEAAYGEVRSSRGNRSDYAEGGARLRVGRQSGRVRPAIEGGVRQTTAPYSYPVDGHSWNAGADLDIGISGTTRFRVGARRSRTARDIVIQRGRDQTSAYTAALTSPRFNVTFEQGNTDSTAVGLVETWLLEEWRPDQLLLTRPDLFGLLYATTQRTRMVSARMTIARGFNLFARGRLDQRQYAGSYDLEQRGTQAGIVWGIRELQLEAGWEQFRYASALITTSNTRFYVRVRRDLLIR